MFDTKEKKAYVHNVKNGQKYDTFSKWISALKNQRFFKGNRSAPATIFLEPNFNSLPIASILGESDYYSYWKKTSMCTNIEEIFLLIQKEILPNGKFSGTAIQEISKGLEFHFFGSEKQLEKKMTIITNGVLLGYEVRVFDQVLQETHLPFSVKAIKRTLDEINTLIQYVFLLKVCHGQSTNGNLKLFCLCFLYIFFK